MTGISMLLQAATRMKTVYNDYKVFLDKLNDAKLKNYLGFGIPLLSSPQYKINVQFCIFAIDISIGHA